MANDDEAMIVLGLLAILAQAGDAITYLALPAGAEMNPLVMGLTPLAAIFLKVGAVMLAIAAAGEELHHNRRELASLILGVVIFAGALGFGSNLSVLLP